VDERAGKKKGSLHSGEEKSPVIFPCRKKGGGGVGRLGGDVNHNSDKKNDDFTLESK